MGEIRDAFAQYPHIGPVLPALGYGAAETEALRATIERTDAEIVVAATPVNLGEIVETNKTVVPATYNFSDSDQFPLAGLVDEFLRLR